MSQVIYVKNGKIGYFQRTSAAFWTSSFIMFCFLLCVLAANTLRSKKLLCGDVRALYITLHYMYMNIENEALRIAAQPRMRHVLIKKRNEIEKYYRDREVEHGIMYIAMLLINVIILLLFFFSSFVFNSLLLKKTYPICIYTLFLLSYLVYNLFNIECFIEIKVKISEEFIDHVLNWRRSDRFYIFICCVICGIAVISYYFWELSAIEEYDMIAYKVLIRWILSINPNLFKTKAIKQKIFETKSGGWISSCYIEIPREIGIAIFGHFNLRSNNDVNFYIRESDKETLICELADGSVMYSEISVI